MKCNHCFHGKSEPVGDFAEGGFFFWCDKGHWEGDTILDNLDGVRGENEDFWKNCADFKSKCFRICDPNKKIKVSTRE